MDICSESLIVSFWSVHCASRPGRLSTMKWRISSALTSLTASDKVNLLHPFLIGMFPSCDVSLHRTSSIASPYRWVRHYHCGILEIHLSIHSKRLETMKASRLLLRTCLYCSKHDTVPFHSIRQSRVTGPQKSTKCHDGHGHFGEATKSFLDSKN